MSESVCECISNVDIAITCAFVKPQVQVLKDVLNAFAIIQLIGNGLQLIIVDIDTIQEVGQTVEFTCVIQLIGQIVFDFVRGEVFIRNVIIKTTGTANEVLVQFAVIINGDQIKMMVIDQAIKQT